MNNENKYIMNGRNNERKGWGEGLIEVRRKGDYKILFFSSFHLNGLKDMLLMLQF